MTKLHAFDRLNNGNTLSKRLRFLSGAYIKSRNSHYQEDEYGTRYR